jgi:hypothetical protein
VERYPQISVAILRRGPPSIPWLRVGSEKGPIHPPPNTDSSRMLFDLTFKRSGNVILSQLSQ